MSAPTVSAARTARLVGTLVAGRPAYRALADALRLAVADGRIAAGTRLPSERELTAALDGLVERYGLQEPGAVGEFVAGAVLKHSRDFNLARETVLGSALDPRTPAYDIQQACGTGLQAVIAAANKIALGQTESAVAGVVPGVVAVSSSRAVSVPVTPAKRSRSDSSISSSSASPRSCSEARSCWTFASARSRSAACWAMRAFCSASSAWFSR